MAGYGDIKAKDDLDQFFSQVDQPRGIHLETIWKVLGAKGIGLDLLTSRAMLSPGTCCLVNPDKERTVERAFAAINQTADMLKRKYR